METYLHAFSLCGACFVSSFCMFVSLLSKSPNNLYSNINRNLHFQIPYTTHDKSAHLQFFTQINVGIWPRALIMTAAKRMHRPTTIFRIVPLLSILVNILEYGLEDHTHIHCSGIGDHVNFTATGRFL